jgi:hypothetical protein
MHQLECRRRATTIGRDHSRVWRPRPVMRGFSGMTSLSRFAGAASGERL